MAYLDFSSVSLANFFATCKNASVLTVLYFTVYPYTPVGHTARKATESQLVHDHATRRLTLSAEARRGWPSRTAKSRLTRNACRYCRTAPTISTCLCAV